MRPEDVAGRIWPGRSLDIEELCGGITNRNVKVSIDGEAYVLRVGGKDTELLGIDREAEHRASLAAAAVGVGPEVVAFLEREGYLVIRFIAGRSIPPDEMRQPPTLRRAAQTLVRVHTGSPIPGRFDSFRAVETYFKDAAKRGVRAGAYERAHAVADQIERARGEQPEAPCHNDLLNANFIDDGVQIRIVDWEYAGMGDVFFDLANFSINHELDEGENRELLAAYFGEVREPDLRSLVLMRFMSDFREAMWGVIQQAISDLDFDFRGYADEHFSRLERTARDPAFIDALETSKAESSGRVG